MHRKENLIRHTGVLFGVQVLLTIALFFTGCGMQKESGKSNANSNTQPKQASAPVASEPANTSASPAAPAAPSAPALATSDGDKPGIRVEVTELKRTSGDTV